MEAKNDEKRKNSSSHPEKNDGKANGMYDDKVDRM